MPVSQIRKETGEVTELITKERSSECIIEQFTDVLVPHLQEKTRSDDPSMFVQDRISDRVVEQIVDVLIPEIRDHIDEVVTVMPRSSMGGSLSPQ